MVLAALMLSQDNWDQHDSETSLAADAWEASRLVPRDRRDTTDPESVRGLREAGTAACGLAARVALGAGVVVFPAVRKREVVTYDNSDNPLVVSETEAVVDVIGDRTRGAATCAARVGIMKLVHSAAESVDDAAEIEDVETSVSLAAGRG